MGRSPCCEKAHTNKGAWTKEEDQRLVDHIRTHGEGCWRSLPKSAGLLRCGKSCRLRWINYLRPDLKRGNFSKEEDELIIKLHSMVGNKWSLIAGRLPGRTDNEIKNYWNTHIKRKLICRGIDPQTHCSLNATATSAAAAAAANSQPELRNSPVPSVPNPEITLTNLRTNEELMARPAASIIRQLNTAHSHMEIRNAPLSGITITSRGMELKVRTESIDERNCSSGLTIEDPQQQQERTCQQNQEINLELSIGLPSATMTSSANSAESKLRLLPYQLFSTPASSPVAAARMGSLCSQSSFQKSKYGSFDLTN